MEKVIRVYTLEQAKRLLIRRAIKKVVRGLYKTADTVWSVFVWLSPLLTVILLISHWVLIGY